MFGTVVRKKDGVVQVNVFAVLNAELDFKTKFQALTRISCFVFILLFLLQLLFYRTPAPVTLGDPSCIGSQVVDGISL